MCGRRGLGKGSARDSLSAGDRCGFGRRCGPGRRLLGRARAEVRALRAFLPTGGRGVRRGADRATRDAACCSREGRVRGPGVRPLLVEDAELRDRVGRLCRPGSDQLPEMQGMRTDREDHRRHLRPRWPAVGRDLANDVPSGAARGPGGRLGGLSSLLPFRNRDGRNQPARTSGPTTLAKGSCTRTPRDSETRGGWSGCTSPYEHVSSHPARGCGSAARRLGTSRFCCGFVPARIVERGGGPQRPQRHHDRCAGQFVSGALCWDWELGRVGGRSEP